MFNTSELDKLLREYQTTVRELILQADSNEAIETGLFDLLREIYSRATQLLGVLTPAQETYIEDQLTEQLYGNSDPSETWSLENLIGEFTGGVISAAMLASRFDLYAGSTRGTLYGAVAVEEPYLLATRELGATDDHCIDCLYYATLGPQSLIDVILPGRACQCYGNCLCRVVVPGRN